MPKDEFQQQIDDLMTQTQPLSVMDCRISFIDLDLLTKAALAQLDTMDPSFANWKDIKELRGAIVAAEAAHKDRELRANRFAKELGALHRKQT
jgi:hypothetical protein